MRAGVSLLGAAALVLGLASASAALKPGSLDPRFGTRGKVTTPVTSGYDYASKVGALRNGKILVAGGTDYDFLLLRYNANGKLDTSFGSEGKVITDFDGGADSLRGLVLQPDGKIVVAGTAHVGSEFQFALARYKPGGSLDTSFGTGGKVTTSFGGYAIGEDVALQPGGKLLVAGGKLVAGPSFETALARYNANGTLDTTFGSAGTVVRDLGGGMTDLAYTVIALPDGASAAGGLVSVPGGGDMFVARFDGSGNLVPSFGTSGVTMVDFMGGSDRLSSLARLPNGDIVGGGYAGTGVVLNPYDSALVVLKPNGTLDSSFSSDGKATFSVGKTDILDNIVVVPGLFSQAPPRIAGSGSVFDVDHYNCSALVVNLDGSLDSGFGANGILRLPLSSSNENYCGVPGLADRGIGGRDLILFGGEDLSSTHARIIGAEVFADPMHSGCPPTTCRFFNGTAKHDKITGTKGRDYMLGKAGNDLLIGRGGRNVLSGGPGRDTCVGNPKKTRFISCERIRPR